MVTYVRGNLFKSPAQVLVNTVNTVGVMEQGLALQYKRLFPKMFREYQELCESGQIDIGHLHLYRTPGKWVLNFPTKKHWRSPSRVEYVKEGLTTFKRICLVAGIRSIAFPPLGCGNGRLDFTTQVKPLMEKYLGWGPATVLIYPEEPPVGPPEHEDIASMRDWLNSEPASLPFAEVWSDLVELLKNRHTFKTLAKGRQYEASAIEEPPTIVIEAANRQYQIGQDEVMEFWQQLCEYGLSYRRVAPNHWRVHYLVPIFSYLSYVDRVEVSESQEGLERNASIGLQVSPRAALVRESDSVATPRVLIFRPR